MINPIYNGKSFFDVLDGTNLLEGDMIRIYTQIIDRIGQIQKANISIDLSKKLDNCKDLIEKILEGIYYV